MTDVFVLGLDDDNLAILERLPHDVRYHRLLEPERLVGAEDLDFGALLDEAEQQLDSFPGRVDAIVGYWDFPVSSMVPILCQRRALPAASLESVVKCEHKYWSRLEQQKVIEDHPAFGIVDLDQPEHRDELPEGMDFPVWVKPVKSASSALAFHVRDGTEFRDALHQIREGVDTMGKPFEFVLDQIDLPDEIATIGSGAALVEDAVSGRQATLEGYEYGGEVTTYGVIDSLTYPDTPSFLRYEYPSQLPGPVQERMRDAAEKVIRQVGYTSAAFNIEFFWDDARGRLDLLEVNPRHSQSHAWLFEQVDGRANHEVMLDLALGSRPRLESGAGPFETAAKWYLRRFDDGVVRRTPSAAEVQRVEDELGGVRVDIVAEEGVRLSELRLQDSYSFELAQIYVAGRDRQDLEDKYARCVEMLAFEVDEDGRNGGT
jgi:biotin carboxylase